MKRKLRTIGSAFLLMTFAAAVVWVFGSFRSQDESLATASLSATAGFDTALSAGPQGGPATASNPEPIGLGVDRPLALPTPAIGFSPPVTLFLATGGPYISEAEALEKGRREAPFHGTVDPSVRPTAVFTAAKNLYKVIGGPDKGARSEREIWIVGLEGRFSPRRGPAGAPRAFYRKLFLIYDATTGFPGSLSMTERIR